MRHVEGEFEFVARVPVALKSDVAVFGSGGNRFAVQREPEGTAPAGNPQRESEVPRRLDRDRDFAAEGIAAADFDFDAVPVDAARRRNIQPEFVFRFRPREGAELRQEPAEAGRAAGAVEPRLALLADMPVSESVGADFKQIGVEELAALQ